jgi:hypothetical protein
MDTNAWRKPGADEWDNRLTHRQGSSVVWRKNFPFPEKLTVRISFVRPKFIFL